MESRCAGYETLQATEEDANEVIKQAKDTMTEEKDEESDRLNTKKRSIDEQREQELGKVHGRFDTLVEKEEDNHLTNVRKIERVFEQAKNEQNNRKQAAKTAFNAMKEARKAEEKAKLDAVRTITGRRSLA